MTVSELACKVIPSPNRYWGRAYGVTKITPHHMAGNLSIETCGSVFENPSRQASSNYGIGTDGRIACYVDEDDAAWTSSNWDNDNRAITFEIANDDTTTWSISDAAWDSTVALCVDICRRYGIDELVYTGDSSGNLTEHRMFASTACPGPWLHARMGKLAEEVNEILREGDDMSILGYKNPDMHLRRDLPDCDVYQHIYNASKQLTRTDNAGWDNPEGHDMFGRVQIIEKDVREIKEMLQALVPQAE